jgi:hypothetical protein
MNTNMAKAMIINKDTGDRIKCLFNPNEYTFQKHNNWAREQTPGASVPQLEFGGGMPATLQMTLFFDTGYDNKTGSPIDVRKTYTDKLWELMMVNDSLKDPKTLKGRPPKVQFIWGSTWYFEAVILDMSLRFTLFTPDGTPVRARVEMTFQQTKDDKQLAAQNPTSGGMGGERVWTVKERERLCDIAYAVYGDTKKWREIAVANRLDQVRDLTPGTVLLIPRV